MQTFFRVSVSLIKLRLLLWSYAGVIQFANRWNLTVFFLKKTVNFFHCTPIMKYRIKTDVLIKEIGVSRTQQINIADDTFKAAVSLMVYSVAVILLITIKAYQNMEIMLCEIVHISVQKNEELHWLSWKTRIFSEDNLTVFPHNLRFF